MSTEAAESVSSEPNEDNLKRERKIVRGKITRSIKRVQELASSGVTSVRRLEKELEQLRRDYDRACEIHCRFYDFIGADAEALDKWESELADDVFGIEQEIEERISELKSKKIVSTLTPNNATVISQPSTSAVTDHSQEPQTPQSDNLTAPPPGTHASSELQSGQAFMPTQAAFGHPQIVQGPIFSSSVAGNDQADSGQSFDDWIDKLIEFQETALPPEVKGQVSIADALYKLEAGKDIPSVTLAKFDGNPLEYADFIDRFKIHIHDKGHISDDMRMIQLKMHLTGDAERSISGLGSKGIMYATALKTLKEQFGQRSVIARALISKLTSGDRIGRNDRTKLRDFSIDLINCLATIQCIGFSADINANENLRKIITRLPDNLIERWRAIASELREKGQTPSVRHISDFVRKRVKAEFDPDFGDINRVSRNERSHNKGVFSAQRDQAKAQLKCFVCQNENHKVPECPKMIQATIEERLQLARKARLCFGCLKRGHPIKECRSKKNCDKDPACTFSHHPLLHSDPEPAFPATPASGMASILDNSSMMPVLRAQFRAPNGRVREGNLLIDSGAGTTVIRRDFAKQLGLQGKRERIHLAVVGGEKVEQPESRRVHFWISSVDGGEEFKVEAHEIERTVLNVQGINKQWLASLPYLNDIQFSHTEGPVDLILGVHYSHLHAEEESRQGRPFDPVARKTKLGWYVIGSESGCRTSPVCSISFVQPVNLEKFYEFETLGVQARDCSCPKSPLSLEDKRAMELLESSCELQGNRYVIGLPWKDDKALLPNNRPLAEARLRSLERNLKKTPEKAEMYHKAVLQYEENGWARRLTEAELAADTKPVYFLPHHGVWRPDKISTPLRVVFDPACQFQGTCLNSFLYKGPGLIGNLLGVLLRFREEKVGFMGDISKMFLQICLPESDTHVQRFLWRNLDTTAEPTVYALQRVTFGAKPSPDMASYVMLKMAKDNKAESPRAAVVLSRDRYMDDLIHSCPTFEQARQTMEQIDRVLDTGSFKIKEWLCSSANAQQIFQEDADMKYNLDGESGTKTLGVAWNPRKDTIGFASREINLEKPTKRAILSSITRLYDPLGLASAVTIKARIAMQEVWKAKEYDWDDPLPAETRVLWEKIFQEIKSLQEIEVPRCLKPDDAYGEPELHVFADASELAYGAVAYFLWLTANCPEVKLISAKARVAPLRQSTIPRLELMAALIAARLASTLNTELKIKPCTTVLWSDSKIVLRCLRSESSNLKIFVGVRVAEIQSTWPPSHWRHVPTKQNPADDLSRGISVDEMTTGRWMNGPLFLKRPKSEWPDEDSAEDEPQEEDPEGRKTPVSTMSTRDRSRNAVSSARQSNQATREQRLPTGAPEDLLWIFLLSISLSFTNSFSFSLMSLMDNGHI